MDMKTTKTILKTSLAGLFLMTTLAVMAQTGPGKIERPPLNLGPVNTGHDDPTRISILTEAVTDFDPTYEEANVVLFYNPTSSGPSMTLVASLKEDHAGRTGANALSFTLYKWYYMGQDGATAIDGPNGLIAAGLEKDAASPDANKHQITQLSEGFHYFKVEGYIIPEGLTIDDELCTVQEEIFVVFVLPELASTVTNTSINPSLFYCESDASSQTNVVLTAGVEYANYSGTPPLDQFDLKYTWYAIKSNNSSNVFAIDDTDFPEIDENKIDITGADIQTQTTDVFTPDISEIGTYKFFVEVEYTIKGRNYDGNEVDPVTNRVRPYVIYRGWFGGATQDDASIVYVTPQPGKPHITIEAVND